MSTAPPINEVATRDASHAAVRAYTALEVLLLYAGILTYVWRWQFSNPRAWMGLLAVILLSHIAHRDTLRTLGLAVSELRASAQIVLPLALALFLPVVVFGLASHRFVLIVPGRQTLLAMTRYLIWCLVQQYLAQSYIHNRLMTVIRNPHLSSVLVGVMFGATHIPNPILMIVTTLGGLLLAEVFARHRNILPLALAQAVGGFLVAALSPSSLIHNMRVGPGYFFYGLR